MQIENGMMFDLTHANLEHQIATSRFCFIGIFSPTAVNTFSSEELQVDVFFANPGPKL